LVITKKQCAKCKKMLDRSEFYRDRTCRDGLYPWCKECKSEYQKEMHTDLKIETMIVFGSQCMHVNNNGVRCSKNVIDNLDKLELCHPNGDGNAHRDLISNGYKGYPFYRALKNQDWDTNGYDIEIRCTSHHLVLDRSGKKNSNYKKGKFNNKDWLKKKYETMSLKDIAIECGVCSVTILNRMKKFGHPRRKPWQRP